jgi:hypothetical protein
LEGKIVFFQEKKQQFFFNGGQVLKGKDKKSKKMERHALPFPQSQERTHRYFI